MPNSNIEAEQAVLGSLLLSKEKYPEVDALLSSADFESEVHKEIYECIKVLADQGKGIDHITVSKQLDRNNALKRVGGIDYLKELQTIPVSALAADSYANLVKDQSIDSPVSYITTVGLYSADNELLAVAKLSEPIKKTPETELTLRVRLDY